MFYAAYSPKRLQQPSLLSESKLMLLEPELQVCDLSWSKELDCYLNMLSHCRLLKESTDAPEVNENIWFLPDLLTSPLGHMSWQVTRVLRRIGDRSGGLLLFFHTGRPGHNPQALHEHVLFSQTKLTKLTCIWVNCCRFIFMILCSFLACDTVLIV